MTEREEREETEREETGWVDQDLSAKEAESEFHHLEVRPDYLQDIPSGVLAVMIVREFAMLGTPWRGAKRVRDGVRSGIGGGLEGLSRLRRRVGEGLSWAGGERAQRGLKRWEPGEERRCTCTYLSSVWCDRHEKNLREEWGLGL